MGELTLFSSDLNSAAWARSLAILFSSAHFISSGQKKESLNLTLPKAWEHIATWITTVKEGEIPNTMLHKMIQSGPRSI